MESKAHSRIPTEVLMGLVQDKPQTFLFLECTFIILHVLIAKAMLMVYKYTILILLLKASTSTTIVML